MYCFFSPTHTSEITHWVQKQSLSDEHLLPGNQRNFLPWGVFWLPWQPRLGPDFFLTISSLFIYFDSTAEPETFPPRMTYFLCLCRMRVDMATPSCERVSSDWRDERLGSPFVSASAARWRLWGAFRGSMKPTWSQHEVWSTLVPLWFQGTLAL